MQIRESNMPVKQKNTVIRIVFTASITVMIFGVPGYAAAGGEAFSNVIYVNPPPFSMPDRNAALYRSSVHPVHSRNVEDWEVFFDLLPAEAVTLPPGEPGQTAWAPAKMTGPQPPVEPMDLYSRNSPVRPFLGFSWNHDAGNRDRWNIVFGLGFYISNYQAWNHPVENVGLERPAPDREETDLFEKLMNAMQVVGFQIRYDF